MRWWLRTTETMRTKENDDIIIVNRAQVNAQLAFMSMDTNNRHAKENIQILKCAINNLLEQEKSKIYGSGS